MKKLNRKGFTLVELLAVIVILAIVVGIAIPGINGVIQGAKGSAMSTTITAAADWLADQHAIFNVDQNAVDKSLTAIYTEDHINFDGKAYFLTTNTKDANYTKDKSDLLVAMGLTKDKVTDAWVCVTSAGKVYIQVAKIPKTSEYYTTENWTSKGLPNYGKSDVNKVNGQGNATPKFDETTSVLLSCK